LSQSRLLLSSRRLSMYSTPSLCSRTARSEEIAAKSVSFLMLIAARMLGCCSTVIPVFPSTHAVCRSLSAPET
jgi:hypothetical protein